MPCLKPSICKRKCLELVAHDEGNATGIVIEATLDKGRGPVATVLVQNGVL